MITRNIKTSKKRGFFIDDNIGNMVQIDKSRKWLFTDLVLTAYYVSIVPGQIPDA